MDSMDKPQEETTGQTDNALGIQPLCCNARSALTACKLNGQMTSADQDLGCQSASRQELAEKTALAFHQVFFTHAQTDLQYTD